MLQVLEMAVYCIMIGVLVYLVMKNDQAHSESWDYAWLSMSSFIFILIPVVGVFSARYIN